MKKQPQVTAQTRANLREAFWTLYTGRDIDKITVREITELAGYNRGTFYLYFRDVYDILEGIETEILDKLDETLRRSLPGVAERDLSGLIKSVMELVQPYAKYTMVLLGGGGDPRFAEGLKQRLRPLIATLFPLEGYTSYQRMLLDEFWLSGILGMVTRWAAEPRLSVEELIELLAPAVVPGGWMPRG